MTTELRYFWKPPKQILSNTQLIININNEISNILKSLDTKVNKQYNRLLSLKNFTVTDKDTIYTSKSLIQDIQIDLTGVHLWIDSLPDIVQSDWNTTDTTDMSYIWNKPDVPILESGLIPERYLPSYVDDVLEYATLALFPVVGERGKIYVDLSTDLTYRWSGSTYVEMSRAIITGVKGGAETDYRTGNVNITASNIGLGNVVNIDLSKAIKDITRSGTTFTYTCLDGTTGTFDQQDNNTTYSAGTGLQLTNTTFSVKLGYTTSGNNRAVQADANGNLYVTLKDDNTTYSAGTGMSLSGTTFNCDYAPKVLGSYTSNGGQQNPNYFGKNRVGFLMMNTTVNSNTLYKDWLIMDCYSGSDVGGGVAIGVNRLSLGAYIMRSAAARTSWAESAELCGTHNSSVSLSGSTLTVKIAGVEKSLTNTNTWRPLGTGANDACAGNDSRLSDARPASDVYSWAKASTKPSYSWSEITSKPSALGNATTPVYWNGSGFTSCTAYSNASVNYANYAGYASSYLASRGTVSGSTHAEALKTYFTNNKSTIPRNCLTANYSSAYGHGSLCLGYFLSGYDSAPYGGFYVCHYNTPYYVGIYNGTYTQQQIITSSSIGSQSVSSATYATSASTSTTSKQLVYCYTCAAGKGTGYRKIASWSKNSTGTHDTSLVLLVSNYYNNYATCIFRISYRKEQNATSYNSGSTYARFEQRSNATLPTLVLTVKCTSTTSTLNLYLNSSAWLPFRFTKLDEGGWGDKENVWEFYNNYDTAGISSIPSDETQIAITDMSSAAKLFGGTLTDKSSGWSYVFQNLYNDSTKSIIYLCNGGTHGAHLRGYTTSSSVYLLLIYNNSSEAFSVWGDKSAKFGGAVSMASTLSVTSGISCDSYISCTNLNAIDDVTISKGSGAARLRISNAGVLNANNVIEFSQDNAGNTKHFQIQDRMNSDNSRRYLSIWGQSFGSLISASCASSNSYCCVGIGAKNDLYWDTTAVLRVYGNAKATAWNTTSDIRMKDIIEDKLLNIEDIANSPLFTYKWKSSDFDNVIHVGTSALYWNNILPEVVTGDDSEENYLSLQYGTLGTVFGITIARKLLEQNKEISLLKEEIESLRKQILNKTYEEDSQD